AARHREHAIVTGMTAATVGISATADPDGHPVNLDLDDAVGMVPPTPALRLVALPTPLPAPRSSAPCEQRLRSEPVTTRDVRNYRARSQRFFDDPRLVVIRKTVTSPRSLDHFQPTNADRLSLKRMVKRRHKSISDSEIAHPPPCTRKR